MELPEGTIIKTWGREDVLSIVSELEREGFTGILKMKPSRTNVILIEGEVVGATHGDLGGEAAWEALLTQSVIEAEAHELSFERVQFCFVWYRDVYGYERIYKHEVHRDEILRKVGLADPDKKRLEEILKSEGMEHLVRKDSEEPKDI